MLDNCIVVIANILCQNEKGLTEKSLIEHMVKERKMGYQCTRDALYILVSMGCAYHEAGRYYLG